MNERDLTRRTFVKQSLAAVGPAMVAANALPVVSAQAESGAARLTGGCVGAHPDDPESGRGGKHARSPAPGRPGSVVCLPRRHRRLSGQPLDEATKEPAREHARASHSIGAT